MMLLKVKKKVFVIKMFNAVMQPLDPKLAVKANFYLVMTKNSLCYAKRNSLTLQNSCVA